MHNIEFDQATLVRVKGAADAPTHNLENIDPGRAAHVIIDMQNGFVAEGAPLEVPVARAVVPNINRISAAARAAGVPNIFVSYTFNEDSKKSWSTWFSKMAPDFRDMHYTAFLAGAETHALWPGLEIAPEDLHAEKARFSAFVPGKSNLPEILEARGITTLLISGTLTNICCESTARDAMQRNYRAVLLSDATAALGDAQHNAALNNMISVFGEVISTDDLVRLLEGAAARPAA